MSTYTSTHHLVTPMDEITKDESISQFSLTIPKYQRQLIKELFWVMVVEIPVEDLTDSSVYLTAKKQKRKKRGWGPPIPFEGIPPVT